MGRFRYVPDGPRADALMTLDREQDRFYVEGIPGKVSIFSELLHRCPYVNVAVRMGPPPPMTYDPSFYENMDNGYRRETFEAQTVYRNTEEARRGVYFFAYCNEPKHLDEFFAQFGPKYTVTVRDVQRKALPAIRRE